MDKQPTSTLRPMTESEKMFSELMNTCKPLKVRVIVESTFTTAFIRFLDTLRKRHMSEESQRIIKNFSQSVTEVAKNSTNPLHKLPPDMFLLACVESLLAVLMSRTELKLYEPSSPEDEAQLKKTSTFIVDKATTDDVAQATISKN